MINQVLHPECYHAYLIRRIDRLYYLTDVLSKKECLPELKSKIEELKKIEGENGPVQHI